MGLARERAWCRREVVRLTDLAAKFTGRVYIPASDKCAGVAGRWKT